MKVTLSKRISLLAILLSCVLTLGTVVHAETNRLVVRSGDGAQSRQHTVMEKERWNDTRNLHQKVNKCTEKKWDKADATFNNRSKCGQSTNTDAYWGPNTLRCLGRRTSHIITP